MLGVSEDQQVRLDWREHEKRAGERPNRKSRVGQDRTGFSREESLISLSCWKDRRPRAESRPWLEAGSNAGSRKLQQSTWAPWIGWGRVVGGGQDDPFLVCVYSGAKRMCGHRRVGRGRSLG